MSLNQTASQDNRIVESDLVVAYGRRRISGAWSYTEANMTTTIYEAWEYTRTAQKTYRYVGLSESAATAAVAALVPYYTRGTVVTVWDPEEHDFRDVSGGSSPMADISANLVEGNMWEVTVAVREVDTKTRKTGTSAPAGLFAAENARKYDTGTAVATP